MYDLETGIVHPKRVPSEKVPDPHDLGRYVNIAASHHAVPARKMLLPHRTWIDQSRSSGADVYPSGWRLLIDDMLDAIAAVIADIGATLVVRQIKEKLGLLRFYYRLEDAAPAQEEAVSAIVRTFEDRSASVCLHCGGAGRLRQLGGLMIVLCDEHEAAKLQDWYEIAFV